MDSEQYYNNEISHREAKHVLYVARLIGLRLLRLRLLSHEEKQGKVFGLKVTAG